MTVTYIVKNAVYVNVTNKCSNKCTFCVRNDHDSVNGRDTLWLEREPAKEEILHDILSHELDNYKEVCFCGFGEPTYRIHDILWVVKELKEQKACKVRINTNGHANRINGEDVTPLFEGLIDVCSISLNEKNPEEYDRVCKSIYGPEAFHETLDFTRRVKKYVPRVILSVVHVIGNADVEACRAVAADLGVEFRVRNMVIENNT